MVPDDTFAPAPEEDPSPAPPGACDHLLQRPLRASLAPVQRVGSRMVDVFPSVALPHHQVVLALGRVVYAHVVGVIGDGVVTLARTEAGDRVQVVVVAVASGAMVVGFMGTK